MATVQRTILSHFAIQESIIHLDNLPNLYSNLIHRK